MKNFEKNKTIFFHFVLLVISSCVVDEQGKRVADSETFSVSLLGETDNLQTCSTYTISKTYVSECQLGQKFTLTFKDNGELDVRGEYYQDDSCEWLNAVEEASMKYSVMDGKIHTVVFDSYLTLMPPMGDPNISGPYEFGCAQEYALECSPFQGVYSEKSTLHLNKHSAFVGLRFGKSESFKFSADNSGGYILTDSNGEERMSWFYYIDHAITNKVFVPVL